MLLSPDCQLSFPDVREVTDDDIDPSSNPSDYRPRKDIADDIDELWIPALLICNTPVKRSRMRQGAVADVERKIQVELPAYVEMAIGLRVVLRSRYGDEAGTVDGFSKADGLTCNQFNLCLCLATETPE